MSTPRCGLCGRNNYYLTKTPCCNNWICDDEDLHGLIPLYISCYRNHERYTLCSHHYVEGHQGSWRTCNRCKGDFLAEDYVWFSTNESNFNQNHPKYQAVVCVKCNQAIDVDKQTHIRVGEEYYCLPCMTKSSSQEAKPKFKAQTSTRTSNQPRSHSTGHRLSKNKSQKITAATIDESMKDEIKFKFGKNDKILVEHEKIEKEAHKRASERRGRGQSSSKRSMSTSSAQPKSQLKRKNVQGSSKKTKYKYGKRKASVESRNNKQNKRVRRDSQLKSGKTIDLKAQDRASRSGSQKRSSSRGRTGNSRNEASVERSSSSGKVKEKKKVQWIKKKA